MDEQCINHFFAIINYRFIKRIKGITWDHSRAFPPLVAAAQRYEELHNGVRIHWDKRTLDEFGHKPIDQIAGDYDLIVIDHPWAGFCFEHNLVTDLKKLLTRHQWDDLQNNCVGASFDSYIFDDKLLAIPIDLATPVPSWRPDLINTNSFKLPVTWEDLILMADRHQVIMPAFNADLFLNWMMLLYALEAHPFENRDAIAEKNKAIEAASLLKRLAEPMPKEIINWNPINIAELMTRKDEFIYCPFAYSYGNYCRPSFTDKPLRYGNLIQFSGKRLKSIAGGTGIAISTSCEEVEMALDFSIYCASPNIQSSLYTLAGGQAVRRETWMNKDLTALAGGFYADSYLSHSEALIRPRYNGYVPLQQKAGKWLQQFILGEVDENKLIEEINTCYRET